MAAYDPEEDEDVETALANSSMPGGVPNVPRDPDAAKKQIMKDYIMRGRRGGEGGYASQEIDPSEPLRESNRNLAMINLMNQAANAAGTIGGKTASSDALRQYTEGAQRENLQEIGDIQKERQLAQVEENRNAKMMAYLAARGDLTAKDKEMIDIARERNRIAKSRADAENQKVSATDKKSAQELKDLEAAGGKKAAVFDEMRNLRKNTAMTGPVAGRLGQAANVMGFGVSEDFDKLNAKQMSMVNAYIKEMTGASAGAEEMKRLMQVMPSVADNDSLFENKLQALEDETNAIINERRTARGLQPIPAIARKKTTPGSTTMPGAVGAVGAGKTQTPPPPPPVGTVRGKFKFKGGNPSDKNNWEAIQ